MVKLRGLTIATVACSLAGLGACSDADKATTTLPPATSSGGSSTPPEPPGTAGTTSTGSGGAASGGTIASSTGGISTGGIISTGGAISMGGSVASGGATGGNASTKGGAASSGGSKSTGGNTATGGSSSTSCDGGPLDAPIGGCEPEPVPDTGDYYADCVTRINQFRWECQCLPPLERWTEGEDCANQQAQYDYEQDEAHAGIRANICENGGSAQNECPGYSPNFSIVGYCLQQMWDEGPGEPFEEHGHYINMSNEDFGRVACGMYETPEGDIWAVQNFTR